MKKCGYCGKEARDGWYFCPYCGEVIEDTGEDVERGFRWLDDEHKQFAFGAYPQAEMGPTFKIEPIIWDVLEIKDGIVFGVSHVILDYMRLNDWEIHGFPNKLFTKEEKDMIMDGPSLLSKDEVEEYLPEFEERAKRFTKYADSKRTEYGPIGNYNSWWLESVRDSDGEDFFARVMAHGDIDETPFCCSMYDCEDMSIEGSGLVPAIRVKIKE